MVMAEFPNVITSVDFEKILKSGIIVTRDGREPKAYCNYSLCRKQE